MNCNGSYFSSQEKIAYFLTQEAVHLLLHFKFLRVYIAQSANKPSDHREIKKGLGFYSGIAIPVSLVRV